MTSFSVQVATGEGLIARFGRSVVLLPTDAPMADALLDLARAADTEHPQEPGRVLPRRVAGLVAQSDDALTLAVVSALEDGLAVLLVGAASSTVTVDGVASQRSGRDATTWVDHVVRGRWDSLVISLPGAGEVDPRSDLQGGVVTGAAVLLSPARGRPSEAAAEPATGTHVTPAPAPPAPFESFALDEPVTQEPLPVVEAVRATVATAEEDGGGEGLNIVQGIECSRQHFNDPTAIYCSVCGISMVHQTHNLVPGPRPPLGVLVVDDGAVFTVDGDYVLGREPEGAEEVQGGRATALTLDDPDVTMSRVHARLVLEGWNVLLTDAGSANGTYVARPGEADWTRLVAGEPVTLTPGTRLSLGGRTLVFDYHHRL